MRSDVHRRLLRLLYQDLRGSTQSPDTAYTRLSSAATFLSWLESRGLTVGDVTDLDIREYLSQFSTAASKNTKLQAIRKLARLAEKYMGLEGFARAAREVKYAKQRLELPKIPRPVDAERLIQNSRQPYRAVLALLYEGGLRLAEALSLRYGDVELWDYGYRVRVRSSKSMGRTVYIIRYQGVLREWLEQHRSRDPNDWLFYSSTGFPLRPSAFRMYLYRLARSLGIDQHAVHPHALRHLRATELYKSRALTELELMKLFGWRTRTMIDVYAMITQDDVEESLARLYGFESRSPRGEERDGIIESVDLFPTLCELAGVPAPAGQVDRLEPEPLAGPDQPFDLLLRISIVLSPPVKRTIKIVGKPVNNPFDQLISEPARVLLPLPLERPVYCSNGFVWAGCFYGEATKS